MKIIKIGSSTLFGLIGIILVSCIPTFFENGGNLNFQLYFQNVWSVIQAIITPSEWSFRKQVTIGNYREMPLFEYIFNDYVYSMTILLSSLLIAVVMGAILALSMFFLPRKTILHRTLNSLEAIPDLVYIFALQLLVVWFFKKFGVLIFDFVYLGEERIYLAPIISLSILPTILFFKVILLLLEEEWNREYVQLAKSKGMNKFYILIHHCVRNIKKNLIIQSKPVVWATISSLLVVEYLYNFYGVVRLVLFDNRPFIIAVALALLFVPFFLFYSIIQVVFKIEEKQLQFSENEILFKRIRLFSWDTSQLSGRKLLNRSLSFSKNVFSAFLQLLRRPKFLLGFIFIFGFVIISVAHPYIKDVPIERVGVYVDESGEYQAPPHPPGKTLLGTDTYGYSFFDILITGAKYTILVSGLIALMRVLSGYILTIPYIFLFEKKTKFIISKIADGMQFIPLTLIAYILLVKVVIFLERDKQLAESLILENALLEIGILIIFVIPIMLNTLGNEADLILKKDFIQSAIALGGSKTHIFMKHITPHLLPRMIFLFGQQMILVLQVLMHLGVFKIFFGGAISMGGVWSVSIPLK
ncbi:ABC transporter permease subunit [Bacillus sp. SCS-153A]|uniref:ABC transporter permease subunit n=1 Tax=Rossellomorea sedimentorum TaxID=3115294 RepID=UPI003906BC88